MPASLSVALTVDVAAVVVGTADALGADGCAAGLAAAGGHAEPYGPAGTFGCSTSYRGRWKSSTRARLFACASRTDNGCNPKRHSIIFNTDVWSNSVCGTCPCCDQGEITRHGTRNPRRPSVYPSACSWGVTVPLGGGTWSKNPPHSS